MKKSELKSFIKEEIKSILEGEDTQKAVEDTKELTAAIQDLKKAKEEAGLAEQDEDDDENKMHKDALKGAKAAKGKSKKLDTAIKALSDIKKEMVSIVNQWKKSEGEEKEKLQSDLKKKTGIKKELEALIKKLEKDVV